jgi:hypothetical protein
MNTVRYTQQQLEDTATELRRVARFELYITSTCIGAVMFIMGYMAGLLTLIN